MDLSKLRAVIPPICLVLALVVLVNVSYMSVKVSTTPLSESPLYGQYDVEYASASNGVVSESLPLPSPSAAVKRVQRLPQCLIIGVRKGGTRALLDALALHPQIRVARREMHFFNSNETYAKGIDWYRSQMPFTYDGQDKNALNSFGAVLTNKLGIADWMKRQQASKFQVTIEKTPGYFTNQFAAERAYRMNSTVKLILIVRDPVTRAISDFTQVIHTKQERNKTLPDFETEAFLQSDAQTINVDYKPVRNSLYSLHLREWLKYFPLQNFLILDGDRFVLQPLIELRKVERFLRVAANGIDKDQVVFNRRKGFYCFRQKDHRTAKCLGNTKGRAHAQISQHSQQKLRKNFLAYNRQFYKMVNRWWPWD
ncbi:unnamed protein product [Anisakis simplex]|uniref:Sulfotransfer_1 domain-containing protein n=1 Tax=Anisakis simplex TaxID=6269 RepID=A0A0M3JSA7_ANISI|nr:unnamed protein product [Anisakis simplex]